MQPFQSLLRGQPGTSPVRRPLCSYYSSDKEGLLKELATAYRSCRSRRGRHSDSQPEQQIKQLLALVVPHGAACDGFFVAASAYSLLNAFLLSRRCSHLTAIMLGTEHSGTTPVALSRQDWLTPLGTARVDTAAVDFLSQHFSLPVNEAPHNTEHSIENQLPFLLHGAACGWDLAAAGCQGSQQPDQAAASAPAAAAPTAPAAPATLSIVPISVGYLGNQLPMIKAVGRAVRGLMQHLKQQQQQQQQQHLQQDPNTAAAAGGSSRGSGDGSTSGSSEVVLVVTSDFTHAGPWYRELPPAGVSLEDYMRSQDTPVLQAVQQGSADALLSAAATCRNSMCGLYPLAVALEALYGNGGLQAAKPQLLDYRAAHTIFARPDSTGFAAFAVHVQ